MKVSAPGRICLFGEHQDYLGLDVIASAISLRFYIEATPREDNIFFLSMPDINKEEQFLPSNHLTYTNSRDYLKAVVNVLKRECGIEFKKGFNFKFTSEIPINAGASSSSVMLVAWTKLLLELFEHPWKDVPEKIAYIAYKAEVVEFKESGGMMDHFTSAIGGTVHIETKYDPVKIEKFNFVKKGFVLGDSLQPKDTVGILKTVKQRALDSVKFIKKIVPDFSFEKYTFEDIKNELAKIPEEYRKILKGNLINHELTRKAIELFRTGKIEDRILGEMLYTHHEQLRDNIGISTPKIDKMIEESIRAGALGGKINGSGGGGTMFVYAPGKEEEVAEAIERAGGKAYIISIDTGPILTH